jgi:hypothetical protein
MTAVLDSRAEPIPGCPATVTTTRRFAQTRWGLDLYSEERTPALQRRERAMIERRAAGDARGADVLGWLSFSAIISGSKATQITRMARLDDVNGALAHVLDGHGVVGQVAPLDEPLADVMVGTLSVPDVGSRAGWALVQLVATAMTSPAVAVRGRLLGSGPVLADLKARIAAASRRRP